MANSIDEMTGPELIAVMERCDENKARALALRAKYVALGATHGRYAREFNGTIDMERDANRLWNDANARAWEIGAYDA